MLELDWLWLADWQATRITHIPPANANLNRFIDLSLQDCAHLISHFAVYSTHLAKFGAFSPRFKGSFQGAFHFITPSSMLINAGRQLISAA